MKCEQPEFTEEMRKKLNLMHHLLKQRFYTKKELMQVFKTGERQIRMMVSHISHRAPVISISGDNAGYKVATSEEDLQLVEASWAELSSRIEELNKRIIPLLKFRENLRFRR